MEDFKWLDDEILSLLELKEDFLFEKLNKDQIKYYIRESINIGEKIAKGFKNKDIEYLLKKNEVEIVVKEASIGKGPNLRAEIHFDKKIKRIVIYKDSIKQIFETVKYLGIEISEENVYKMHLAHEFYHYIEFAHSQYTNEQLDKIICFSLGPIKRKSTILKTREIAAHAFCKEFLKLKFHPKALDYIFLIAGNAKFADELKDNITYLRKEYLS